MEKQTELERFIAKSPWLFGDSFVKRAFSIWGHMLAAYLLTLAAILVVTIFLGVVSAFFEAIF